MPGVPVQRRTALSLAVVGLFVVGGLAQVALVDSGEDPATLLKDAALMTARAALPLLGLIALGLRWGDWRSEPARERWSAEHGGLSSDGVHVRALDARVDEDFDDLACEALCDGLPEALHRAFHHGVELAFTARDADRGLRTRWQPAIVDPARGAATPDRVFVYRDAFREQVGDDLVALRAAVVHDVRATLAEHVSLRHLGVDAL